MTCLKNLLYLFFLSTLVSSCASYKTQFADGHKNVILDQEEIIFSVYLIGDAGNVPADNSLPILDAFKNRLDQESSQSTVIWMGDNIYPVGMAPPGSPEYKEASGRLLGQLKTMDNYPGRIHFIPGNHDWYDYDRAGLERQEAFVENYLSNRSTSPTQEKSSYFLPNYGCPDPQLLSMTDSISLIITDTQWSVKEASKGNTNPDCKIQSRDALHQEISRLLAANKTKTILFALHHPVYSYGSHGGRHHWVQHIFPLIDIKPYLYIPLPGLGSLAHYVRHKKSSQEVNFKESLKMRETILSSLENTGPHIIASGHEHVLQYIKREGHHFVVSGSASKSEAVGMGTGSQFASPMNGYAKISFLKGNKKAIQFFVWDKKLNREVNIYTSYLD